MRALDRIWLSFLAWLGYERRVQTLRFGWEPVTSGTPRIRPAAKGARSRPAQRLLPPWRGTSFSLTFAAAVALLWLFISNFARSDLFDNCKRPVLQGAAIDAASVLLVVGGAAASILVFALRRQRPQDLAYGLVVGRLILAVAMLLVAVDSATYTIGPGCGAADKQTIHVGFLYAAWGAPLAVLLVQTRRSLIGPCAAGAR